MIERFEQTIELEDSTEKRTASILYDIRRQTEYGVESISDKVSYEFGFGFKVRLKEGVFFELVVAECRKHLKKLKRLWPQSIALRQFTVISRTLRDLDIKQRLIQCIDTIRHAACHWREQRRRLRKQRRYDRRMARIEPIHVQGLTPAL
ncbi:MAG: hypothetical protein KGJ33_02415 [Patescibacteria group bacterium]|nr:hypothetical protein [Patescibacteria group bacterium]